MTASSRLQPRQWLLVAAAVVLAASLEVTMVRGYLETGRTATKLESASFWPTTLANVQRETLRLQLDFRDLGTRTTTEDILVRRQVLANHLAIARANASNPDVLDAVRSIDRDLAEFDTALATENGSPTRPRAHAALDRLQATTKQGYDTSENRFFHAVGGVVREGRSAAKLLLGMSALLLLALALFWISVRRTFRGEVSRLAAFPALSPTPVLALAADGAILYRNAAAQEAAHGFGDGTIDSLLPPRYGEAAASALEHGETQHVPHATGDRQLVWSFFPIPAQNAVHCYCEDVTQRHELEAQLRQSQKLDAVGKLAGGVAHDFNNLLTAIIGYAQLIQDDVRAVLPSATHPLRQIVVAGERAAELTRQLLAFSRRQELQPKVIDLNAIVEESLTLIARLLGEHIVVVHEREPEPRTVKVDPTQLGQVVINLALNARDAISTAGTLTIATSSVVVDREEGTRHEVPAGRYTCLAVEDDGCGMDEETLQRAFEPFFTTKDVNKGTGLGLPTVYGIVKQSGGFITVTSSPGNGARFAVHLPETNEAMEPTAEVQPAQAGLGHERVLLVEDELIVRGLAQATLERAGYTVVSVEKPVDAIELARREQFDLMVTDVVMPELTGPQLAAAVWEFAPGLQVLYMSGYTRESLAPGMNGGSFLQKPFLPRELTAKVHGILGNARTGRIQPHRSPVVSRGEGMAAAGGAWTRLS